MKISQNCNSIFRDLHILPIQQIISQGGEARDAQRFAAHTALEPHGGDGRFRLLLRKAGKTGGERVRERLAAL